MRENRPLSEEDGFSGNETPERFLTLPHKTGFMGTPYRAGKMEYILGGCSSQNRCDIKNYCFSKVWATGCPYPSTIGCSISFVSISSINISSGLMEVA